MWRPASIRRKATRYWSSSLSPPFLAPHHDPRRPSGSCMSCTLRADAPRRDSRLRQPATARACTKRHPGKGGYVTDATWLSSAPYGGDAHEREATEEEGELDASFE